MCVLPNVMKFNWTVACSKEMPLSWPHVLSTEISHWISIFVVVFMFMIYLFISPSYFFFVADTFHCFTPSLSRFEKWNVWHLLCTLMSAVRIEKHFFFFLLRMYSTLYLCVVFFFFLKKETHIRIFRLKFALIFHTLKSFKLHEMSFVNAFGITAP